MRVAAINAEDLMNIVAGSRCAARSTTIASFVERFGDRALEIDYIGAAFVADAVASALVGVGHDAAEADRVAECCQDAIREARAGLDDLVALTVDKRDARAAAPWTAGEPTVCVAIGGVLSDTCVSDTSPD